MSHRRLSAISAANLIADLNDSGSSSDDSTAEEEITPTCGADVCDSSDSSVDDVDIQPLRKRLKVHVEDSGDHLSPIPTVDLPDDGSSSECAHVFTGRNGMIWRESPRSSDAGRLPTQNVFRANEGITTKTRATVTDTSKQSAFSLLIDEKTIRHIKNCTEIEANRVLGKTDWSLSLDELEKFIGLCYLRGVFGGKNLPVHSFWSKEFGLPIFKETMPRDRFTEIMKFLRFDIKSRRKDRLSDDKFALASEIWKPFIHNCQQCYVPSENLTIDEQLLPCKSRCPFTQFLPSKPDKYGIKFFLLVDVRTKYLCNGFPYLGKHDPNFQKKPLGENVALELMKPYYGLGYGVTTDNFFTSLKLCDELKSKKTSLVGTIKRNRRELPDVTKIMAKSPVHDTKVLYSESGCTLTVYKAKKSKVVPLLSTMHKTVDISESDMRKPETILHYNTTKVGVDCIDQMVRLYSTKAASRRWPVAVFYNILDLAGINSWILFKSATNSTISRRNFLLDLGKELTCFSSENNIYHVFSNHSPSPSRRFCAERGCRNKTKNNCVSCHSRVCGKHAENMTLCLQCKK